MLEKTDAELVRAARNEPAAFGELYRRHVRSIHAFFRSRTGAADAFDLTAETFAQAALSLKRFRDEADGSAAPWLYGIARNLLRRYRERDQVERRARRRLGMPIRAYETDFESVDARADAARLEPDLRAAVEELPASQREALELRVVDDLSYEDVAARLGTTEVAARLRVMRALGSLSRLLKAPRIRAALHPRAVDSRREDRRPDARLRRPSRLDKGRGDEAGRPGPRRGVRRRSLHRAALGLGARPLGLRRRRAGGPAHARRQVRLR